MKVLQWVASSRDDLRGFPKELRIRVALALWQLQLGRRGPYRKRPPMFLLGLRVLYLTRRPRWRIVLVRCLDDAVVVLQVFQSVGQPYPPADLVELRRRLGQLRRSALKPRDDDDPFEALGLTPADAAPLRLRATLFQELTDLLGPQHGSRAERATRLGIAPARLSDLRQGKLDRFSLDMLVELLHRAGAEVHLHIQPSASTYQRVFE